MNNRWHIILRWHQRKQSLNLILPDFSLLTYETRHRKAKPIVMIFINVRCVGIPGKYHDNDPTFDGTSFIKLFLDSCQIQVGYIISDRLLCLCWNLGLLFDSWLVYQISNSPDKTKEQTEKKMNYLGQKLHYLWAKGRPRKWICLHTVGELRHFVINWS